MRKHALLTLSVAALSAALTGQAEITALAPNNNPNLGPTVINMDAAATPNNIQAIEQIELRSIGGGTYRCVVTAVFIGGSDSSLVSGLLVMANNPPLWLPDNDLDALNQPNGSTDEFQGSLSSDDLVFVWDNYVGASYPNSGPVANTFICARPNAGVPFNINDVRAISGMPAGGVDPHIAQELPNGNVRVAFLDVNGEISTVDVDPATGATSNTVLAVASSGRAGFVFCHSPFAQRDGSGAARGLTYSEFVSAGSDGLWTEDLTNSGTPKIVANQIQGGTAFWFANPAVVGGTFNWATAAAGYGDPSQLEAACIVNTDLVAGGGNGSIVAYAPIRPGSPGFGFLSGVFLGTPAPAPYQIPPVIGDIEIFPIGNPITGFHDTNTGLLEFPLNNVPLVPGGAQLSMQLLTIDLSNGNIYAANTSVIRF